MFAVRDEPTEWGSSEGPPKYVILRISNASADQVIEFLVPWTTDFVHSVSTNPDLSKQITVSISQKILDIFGNIRGFKSKMRDYLEDKWSATIVTYDNSLNQAVFNVPAVTDLAELKSDLLDKFEEQLGPRWLFAEADVDIALAQGGTVQLNKAQAISKIIDRAI